MNRKIDNKESIKRTERFFFMNEKKGTGVETKRNYWRKKQERKSSKERAEWLPESSTEGDMYETLDMKFTDLEMKRTFINFA